MQQTGSFRFLGLSQLLNQNVGQKVREDILPAADSGKTQKPELMMSTRFEELGLHDHLVQTVAELGYQEPTPIQAAMIPQMLGGCDVIGQAQTGTGKTAAFALPMLHNFTKGCHHIQGLILAPTRELAMQVAKSMEQYGARTGVRVLAVYGGQAYFHQIPKLKQGVDIVVGTPGRLIDLMKQKKLDLSRVSTVVLDEADEMLSMGFVEDIQIILDETPAERQTALFSATLPPDIRRLAQRYMNDPQSCTLAHKQLTVETVEQRHYLVNEFDKLAALTRLFETEDIASALVFTRTRAATGDLVTELAQRGFTAEALSGDLSQEARTRVLERFRNNQVKVLAATDVAARGLDIDDISHVINFDLPPDPEVYVHRIGRTGRAGKTGVALSLITPKERWLMGKIERFTRQRVPRHTLPTEGDIVQKRQEKLMQRMQVWLNRGRCKRELEVAASLAEEGHDPLDIAAAAMRLAQKEGDSRPIAQISKVVEPRPKMGRANPQGRFGDRSGYTRAQGRRDYARPRGGRPEGGHMGRDSQEKGMVRLSLSTGRSHGITVSHVVGSLAHHADIPGRALGRISIQDNRTLVDVPEALVEQVLAKTGNYRIGRNQVQVRRA